MNFCVVAGCGASIQTRRHMCRKHWRVVSKAAKKQVHAAEKRGTGLLDPLKNACKEVGAARRAGLVK